MHDFQAIHRVKYQHPIERYTMAKKLNRSRILYSWILVILALVLTLFVDLHIPMKDSIQYVGYMLIAFCAMGRLYTTMFIGGQKNDRVITSGPYSVVRHPLYFLSLCGMTGVALITGNVFVILIIPASFLLIYLKLIGREEEYLLTKFGSDYADYRLGTPRLIPRLSGYSAPESIVTRPAYVTNAFRDAVWWFAAFPVVESIPHVRGWIL